MEEKDPLEEFADETPIIEGEVDEEMEMLRGNVEQNVVSLARQHPETIFIYFFPPYSMAYWGVTKDEGNLSKQLQFVKTAVEQMLFIYQKYHLIWIHL